MRTVCFDVGGVLLQINHNWKGAMLDAGLAPDLADQFDFPLIEFQPFNDYQKGTVIWNDYCVALGGYLGNVSSEEAGRTHNSILKGIYPGVSDLIDELKAKGYRTGCLSNTNAPHWETFFAEPRLAALQKIEVPIASHLIGAEKPDVRMYHAFERASGAKPEEIVYFDDGEVNVLTAEGIGWTAYVVDPAGDTAVQIRRHLHETGCL
jgi:HAD superfamily hydrolase (TIGR01509 family)